MISQTYKFTCDGCGKEESCDIEIMFTAVGSLPAECKGDVNMARSTVLKNRGWFYEPNGKGGFVDICSDCVDKCRSFRALQEINEEDKPKRDPFDATDMGEMVRRIIHSELVNK